MILCSISSCSFPVFRNKYQSRVLDDASAKAIVKSRDMSVLQFEGEDEFKDEGNGI